MPAQGRSRARIAFWGLFFSALLSLPVPAALASEFPDSAPLIEVGKNLAATIRSVEDVEYFLIRIETPGLYVAETKGELLLRLVIVDQDGKELACGRGSDLGVKVRLKAEHYLVKVYPEEDQTGTFILKVGGPLEVVNWVELIVVIFGGLGLFLFGMKLLSSGLQSVAGDRIRAGLAAVTSNRFLGVFSGMTSTAIVQSSSATTVMVISFVNAGLLTLRQAISVIMGANIGTTVTAWVVSLVGKFSVTSLCYPAIALGVFLSFLRSPKPKAWGSALLGFGILFFGLFVMKDALQPLRDDPGVMDLMRSTNTRVFGQLLLCVGIGTVVTVVVQSSSAVMAITATLAMNGVIDFPTAAALVLGENVGTTITANLASLGTVASAKRAARAHLLFNLIGVAWILPLFPYVILLVESIMGPATDTLVATHIAVFHTAFNLTNTLLLLPFLNTFVKIVEVIVPRKGEEETKHLKYIDPGFITLPTMAMEAAKKELLRMFDISIEMFESAMDTFFNGNSKDRDKIESVYRKESMVDMLERELQEFLARLSQQAVSATMANEITAMLDISNDIERVADHGENLIKLVQRKREKTLCFSEEADEDIREIYSVVLNQLKFIQNNFMVRDPNILREIRLNEQRINKMRKVRRKRHVNRIKEQVCNVDAGLVFIDMLTSFEKIGDHAVNIGEALSTHHVVESSP